MAPFYTLSDDFADNAIARAWTALTAGSGAVSEASARATCTLPSSTAGSHSAYYKSAYSYDLTGDAASININGMVATGVAATMTFDVLLDDNNVYRWRQVSNTITARKVVGGVDTQLYTATWSGTTYKYLRIRESGGTVFFDSSSNGTSWTNRATQTVAGAFAVTSLYAQFGASCGNVASPGALTVEEFNLLSLSTTWRWVEGGRAYQHRIGSVSIAATGGVGYIAVAASKDASGNLVSPVYYSGPLMDGRELTLQGSQAAAQAMAARMPTDGVWHVPPGAFVEGRYTRLYLRSHDGSSFTVREFYPRRFIQADDIEAESIRALHIAAGSITADRLSVLQLSAITADMGTLTAGTITGATIRTAASGARVQLDSTGIFGTDGTTTQWEALNTTGKLTAGGGNVTLDTNGVTLTTTGATAGVSNKLKWAYSGTTIVEQYSLRTAGGVNMFLIEAEKTSTSNGSLLFIAKGTASADGVETFATDAWVGLDGGTVPGISMNAATIDLNGAVSASLGIDLPRSDGTALFGIDATAVGSDITIANNGTATPFGAANNFAGLIIVHATAGDGGVAMFLAAGGTIVEIADTNGIYSTTAGTASSINVYLNSLVLTIENKRGASRTLNVFAIRTRNQQ